MDCSHPFHCSQQTPHASAKFSVCRRPPSMWSESLSGLRELWKRRKSLLLAQLLRSPALAPPLKPLRPSAGSTEASLSTVAQAHASMGRQLPAVSFSRTGLRSVYLTWAENHEPNWYPGPSELGPSHAAHHPSPVSPTSSLCPCPPSHSPQCTVLVKPRY